MARVLREAARFVESFAYRVDLDAGVFLLAATLSLAIAAVTVSVQSLRAALANPARSLQHE